MGGPRKLMKEERIVVRIRIVDPEHYPEGAAKALDGHKGVIVKINPRSMYGRPSPGPAYLVKLLVPIQAWWNKKEQMVSFWIAKSDLRRVKAGRTQLVKTKGKSSKVAA